AKPTVGQRIHDDDAEGTDGDADHGQERARALGRERARRDAPKLPCTSHRELQRFSGGSGGGEAVGALMRASLASNVPCEERRRGTTVLGDATQCEEWYGGAR